MSIVIHTPPHSWCLLDWLLVALSLLWSGEPFLERAGLFTFLGGAWEALEHPKTLFGPESSTEASKEEATTCSHKGSGSRMEAPPEAGINSDFKSPVSQATWKLSIPANKSGSSRNNLISFQGRQYLLLENRQDGFLAGKNKARVHQISKTQDVDLNHKEKYLSQSSETFPKYTCLSQWPPSLRAHGQSFAHSYNSLGRKLTLESPLVLWRLHWVWQWVSLYHQLLFLKFMAMVLLSLLKMTFFSNYNSHML